MTTPSVAHFHPTALQSRFAQDLAEAKADKRLNPTQYQRLYSLCGARPEPALQLARLFVQDAPLALADVLLISDTAVAPVLYLSSALHGLERFKDRHSLNLALQQRLPALRTPTIEHERVQGTLFEAQMQRLVEARVASLDQLDEQLRKVPTLGTVLLDLFLQKLGLLQAATLEQPAERLLQIVEGDSVKRVVRLEQALLEHFCGAPLAADETRRWLADDGQALTGGDAMIFERALVSPADDLHSTCRQLLRDYWNDTTPATDNRRDYLALFLAQGFAETLVRHRHEGSLSATVFEGLRTLTGAPNEVRVEKVSLFDIGQDPLELAGMLLITPNPPSTTLYLYGAKHGLQAFTDVDKLNDHFNTLRDRGELSPYLAREDHSTLWAMDTPQLSPVPIAGPPFEALADSIIQLQTRNLAFALRQSGHWTGTAPTLFDDALDIHALLDPRLSAWDWQDHDSDDMPSKPGPQAPVWAARLEELDEQMQDVQKQQPDLLACTRKLLNQRLAVMTLPSLDADTLLVTWNPTAPGQPGAASSTKTSPLVGLFLEHVTGHSPFDATASHARLIIADGLSRPRVTEQMSAPLLDYLFKRSQEGLHAYFAQAVKTSATQPRRTVEGQRSSEPVLHPLLEQALRLEATAMRDLLGRDSDVLNMLDQTLDWPTARVRRHLGARRPEVHALLLGSANEIPAQRLTCCFVVHERANPGGPLTLWSPLSGLVRFASLAELRVNLLADLQDAEGQDRWLELIAATARPVLKQRLLRSATLTIDTLAIDGNLIDDLLLSRQQWLQASINAAWPLAAGAGFDAGLFNSFIASCLQTGTLEPNMALLIGHARIAELSKILPDWIRQAPVDALGTYADLVANCIRSQIADWNYLFGIPTLAAFASRRVRADLEAHFGADAARLDPDSIKVTLKQYVSDLPLPGGLPNALPAATISRVLSLSECALRQFGGYQVIVEHVAMADGSRPPTWLNSDYVNRLVRRLDLGEQYRLLLSERFDRNGDTYSARQRLFIRDMPAQLRERAFRLRLKKQISPLAYEYLDSVISMPDGVARQSVQGQVITLRPVRLVAAPGMKPDTVTGMYLIGPSEPTLGPVLLYTPYHQAFTLKEYSNEAAFVHDMRTSDALASLIIWRLEDAARSRYEHGGLNEPHLPWSTESSFDLPLSTPAPPTLDRDPVKGHALVFLFEDNLHLIQMMARQQTVSRGEAEWEAFKYLMTLGLEQGSLFLPGELAALVAAWQSQLLLKSGAHAVTQKQWGEALAEYSAALLNLVGYRRAPRLRPMTVLPHPEPAAQPGAESPLPELSQVLDFSWQHQQLPRELLSRLQAFETHEVSLQKLHKEPLTQLYQRAGSPQHYAAIAGRVYPVETFDSQWYIVHEAQRGPRIRLGASGAWELDLAWGLRGGGCGPSSELEVTDLQADIDRLIEVQATGMSQIGLLSFSRARQIAEAHRMAGQYVRVCLENLNSTQTHRPLAKETLSIIQDFLQVGPMTPEILMKIRERVRQIFGGLLAASLNPRFSQRFVMGLNKKPHLQMVAFTLYGDAQRRIFLTERFFRVPAWIYRSSLVTGSDFDVAAHCQASTLIHELSHLESNTLDIAYLQASVPFLDLLNTHTPRGKRFRENTERFQRRTLSLDTPRDQLFTFTNRDQTLELSDRARERVLNITGRQDLPAAREDFYNDPHKRLEIILSNADSLALLITLLGRTRHPVPI
jgi:hypothetical protein